MQIILLSVVSLFFIFGCASQKDHIATGIPISGSPKSLLFAGEEKHIRNISQVTSNGSSRPLHFGAKSKLLLIETREGDSNRKLLLHDFRNGKTRPVLPNEQLYSGAALISSPKKLRVLFTTVSNQSDSSNLYPQILSKVKNFKSNRDGVYLLPKNSEIAISETNGKRKKFLTENSVFDGFPAISRSGTMLAFSSLESGDPDIYLMNTDGSEIQRISKSLGLETEFRFSEDGKYLYFSAYFPRTKKERREYRNQLSAGYVLPKRMALYRVDLRSKKTSRVFPFQYKAHSPSVIPKSNRILFTTTMADPKGKEASIFAISGDGKSLEQVSFSRSYDAYPVFSPDGKRIAWASSRKSRSGASFDTFIADWQ